MKREISNGIHSIGIYDFLNFKRNIFWSFPSLQHKSKSLDGLVYKQPTTGPTRAIPAPILLEIHRPSPDTREYKKVFGFYRNETGFRDISDADDDDDDDDADAITRTIECVLDEHAELSRDGIEDTGRDSANPGPESELPFIISVVQ